MMLHPIFDGAKGVIFDKDGTLLDHGATWVEPTKAFGVKAANGNIKVAKRLLGEQGFDWDSETFNGGGNGVAGNTWAVTTRRFRQSMEARGEDTCGLPQALAWIESFAGRAVPLARVNELLAALQAKGLKIGLATNDVERNARLHLAQIDASEYFDTVVGADSGFGGKPDSGMIHGCAQRMGLAASEVIVVGDTDRDTLAGRAAGCLGVVAVLNGGELTPSIAQTADLVLSQTGDLFP